MVRIKDESPQNKKKQKESVPYSNGQYLSGGKL
jgi:hypothetical protein